MGIGLGRAGRRNGPRPEPPSCGAERPEARSARCMSRHPWDSMANDRSNPKPAQTLANRCRTGRGQDPGCRLAPPAGRSLPCPDTRAPGDALNATNIPIEPETRGNPDESHPTGRRRTRDARPNDAYAILTRCARRAGRTEPPKQPIEPELRRKRAKPCPAEAPGPLHPGPAAETGSSLAKPVEAARGATAPGPAAARQGGQ
jgi:hypothetical protein